MKKLALAVLCLSFSFMALGQNSSQNPPLSPVQRQVQNQTIISNELPAADLTFGDDFEYVGGQVVTLYGNGNEPSAEAEQHVFVKVNPNRRSSTHWRVNSFYWIQFEHRLSTNKYAYKYELPGTTEIGGLSFVYDTKGFLDYDSDLQKDTRSDTAAAARLLAQHRLAFPRDVMRVRMFHLPTPDHRVELMIIYGEAYQEDSKIPASAEGILLDKAAPQAASVLLEHAKEYLTIRKH